MTEKMTMTKVIDTCTKCGKLFTYIRRWTVGSHVGPKTVITQCGTCQPRKGSSVTRGKEHA